MNSFLIKFSLVQIPCKYRKIQKSNFSSSRHFWRRYLSTFMTKSINLTKTLFSFNDVTLYEENTTSIQWTPGSQVYLSKKKKLFGRKNDF